MKRIRQVVSAQKRFKPFFHSTDETGVANLIEAWDFCFDPRTLSAMRQWLMELYGSLEGINRQWGTDFKRLDDVVPMTTDETMQKGSDNWSAWADHRTFMNLTFAKAARKASETVKAVDPSAIGGLVGGQAPSAFGGYDYWLLSNAIDVMEPYNIGVNREIWRSFAPHKPALTTGFGAEPIENDQEPLILSTLPEPVKGISIRSPQRARRGEVITVGLQLEGRQLGKAHAFRVRILDADGRELTMLTRNLAAPLGACSWELPLAVDLKKGTCLLRVREIATGVRAERSLELW